MKISQLMRRDVVVAREAQSLKEAAATLVAHGISGMPVRRQDDRVTGVISEADVLYKERGRAERRGGALAWLLEDDTAEIRAKARARTVAEAMTTPAVTISPSATLAGAARLMLVHGINRLPVVGEDGKLIGIVTRADLVRAFTRSDHEIEGEVRDDILQRVLWIDPSTFTISVRQGEVELTGEVEKPLQVELLQSLVERVPGVVSLRANVGHRDHDRVGRRT
jgi:CBS domain-containing protein